jgi:DNA modification methylase
MLKLELAELSAEGFDLAVTGFSQDELDALFEPLPEENQNDPNDVPETPVDPLSVPGDIWLLGPHRVRCGDSTSITDWEALMQGELADVQFCDPPYNVAYESKLAGSIKNDSMGDKAFYDFLFGFYSCSFSVMKAGAAIYVAHADSEGANFRQAFKDAGFKLASCLMWVKNALVMGRGDFHYRHEPILYGWKTGGAHKWWGGRKQTTVQEVGESSPFERLPDGRYAIKHGDSVLYVSGDATVEEAPSTIIRVDKPKRSALHPTIKPTELIERCLRNNARARDIVIDGFGGSGSTLIAAERLGMVARLQEFDPKFVDVICARYYGYTGRLPVHAETGLEFPRERLDALLAK